MFTGVFVCGFYSVMFLARSKPRADRIAAASAEIAVLFGLMGLVTGPLWGRKSWGVWWQWDAHLTMALLVELIFIGYLIVRKYGGPGSDKLSAAVAIFGMANIPFVYLSANIWRTLHPPTSVIPTLPAAMGGPFWYCVLAFMLLYSVLFMLRLRLANQQAALDELFLEEE
jgi:heme exporter protein C